MSGGVQGFRTAKELLAEQQRKDRFIKEVQHAWDYSMQSSKSNFFRGQKLRRLLREALERYDGVPRLRKGKIVALRSGLGPDPHVKPIEQSLGVTEAE